MGKYKYLLWDIDGTILDFLAAEKAAIKKLFIKYNLGPCTDEMIARYSAINVRYWQALERNEMTKPQILVGRFREFFATEGLDVNLAPAFNDDYQIALGDTISFCDDAQNILKEEKDNYVLVAITNGTRIAQQKKLAKSGLDQIFDHIFISELIGVEKPNKAFFDHVFQQVGIKNTEEVLVIGDSLTSDIRGGVNAGCDTCWYNPNEKALDQDLTPTYVIKDLHEIRNILYDM